MRKNFSLARAASAGFFALLPASAIVGGLAIAPLVGGAGVLMARPAGLREAARRHFIPLILLLSFVGWAALTTAWTPYHDHGQAIRLVATVAFGLLFLAGINAGAEARRLTQAAGAAALLVLAGMLAIEAIGDMPLNRAAQPNVALTWVLLRNPGRGTSILVVLLWAALGGLLARGGIVRIVAALLAGLGAALLSSQFGMDANLVAFALGLGGFAAAYAIPRVAILTVTGGLSFWLLTAPFVTPLIFRDPKFLADLPETWAIRAEIWKFVSARIGEQPWIGRGLDASRTFPDMLVVRGVPTHAVPLHPHSASLQIWLETGAIGAVLAALALIAGGFALSRAFARNRAGAAAACGTLAAIGFIANVSFGAWQEWWVATAFVAAAMVGALARTTSAKA